MSFSSSGVSSSSSSSSSSSNRKLGCKIKEWHAVASWDWDFKEKTCAVCQFELSECCPLCTIPGSSCPPVQGRCSHVFHKHCIKSLDKCPLCRSDWIPVVDPCPAESSSTPQSR